MITLGKITSKNLTEEEKHLIFQFYNNEETDAKRVHFVCANTINKIRYKSQDDYLVCTCDEEEKLAVETFQKIDFFAQRPIDLSYLQKVAQSIYEQVQKDNWYRHYIRERQERKIEFSSVGKNTTFYVYSGDILWLESDNNLTILHLKGGKKKTANIQFKKCQELLSEYNFFRIHKQYIINRKAIVSLSERDKTTLKMTTGEELEIARRRIRDFKKWWEE